jgi:hypothetical protein
MRPSGLDLSVGWRIGSAADWAVALARRSGRAGTVDEADGVVLMAAAKLGRRASV